MFIEEMQVLVDCKRLVENMLAEKKYLLSTVESNTREYSMILKHINRLEDALNGKGVKQYEHP